MNAIRILAAMLCAAILGTDVAFAQRSNPCDPRYHIITPSDCTSAAEEAGKHLGEMQQAIAEESVAIAEARRRFWETYPDKPGAAEAREAFGKKLYGKDFYYFYLAMSEALGGFKGSLVDLLGGKLDGGIPPYASAEFSDWVEEVKLNLGEKPIRFDTLTNERAKSLLTLPERLLKAMAASERKHDIYVFERDWGEFDAVGREPAGLEDPAVYFRWLCVRSQKVGWDEALTEFDGIVKALGKDNVLRAIQQVHAAPRVRFGVLKVTAPRPVKTGPGGSQVDDYTVPMPEGVIGVYADAIRAIKVLATKDDDHRYLLYLLTYQNQPNPLDSKAATQWAFAETAYDRLAVAFGEPEVLQAAHLVRTATKRMTSGTVMDQKAIGATRNEPFEVFEDILARKDPRGYVRSALIFGENLKTPSTADVDAAYKEFVSENGEDKVLATAKEMAAGKPHFAYGDELRYIKEALGRPAASEKPAEARVDFPEYLAWKGFASGAKVTYAARMWQPERYGSDHFVPGLVKYRDAWQLQSVNDDQARLWFTETIYDSNGTAHPPRDTEIAYPAKFAPPATPASGQTRQPATTAAASLVPKSNLAIGIEPTPAPVESGEETIEINGRRIATHWRSASYHYNASSRDKDCSLVVKVWTSDAVPGGLLRKTEDKICPADQLHPYPRVVEETYLESFEGFTPAVADSSQLVTAEYAPPTVALKRAVTANEVTPTPVPTQPPPRPVARPALPPDVAAQIELSQRYSKVVVRAAQAKVKLAQLESKQAGQGTGLPADVRDARDRLDTQLKAVMVAMQKRDNDQTRQSLQSFEDTVSVIEKYLQQ